MEQAPADEFGEVVAILSSHVLKNKPPVISEELAERARGLNYRQVIRRMVDEGIDKAMRGPEPRARWQLLNWKLSQDGPKNDLFNELLATASEVNPDL